MPPEPPGYGHIGDEILKHRREKYTGCYCRISFAYLDSTLGPIHLFPKEDGTMVNYVWFLTCPQHTCTTLHHGSIKSSFTLRKDISSTYSSLAEESERKKERSCSCICIAVFCFL